MPKTKPNKAKTQPPKGLPHPHMHIGETPNRFTRLEAAILHTFFPPQPYSWIENGK